MVSSSLGNIVKIRQAEFARVPTWVVKHPQMFGQGTRIAVYVAIRVAAYEMPNHDWRSDRDLAVSLSEVVGVTAESCRKHMRVMREIGVIQGGHGELTLPHDPPSGEPVGSHVPHGGDDTTQVGEPAPHIPITTRTKKTPRLKDEAVGEPTTTINQQTNTIVRAFFERVESETGHPFLGIKFMGMKQSIVKPALEAGYEPLRIKQAMWAIYTGNRPWTLAVLEQILDGRADRGTQRGTGQTIDVLQRMLDSESASP